MNRNSTGFIIKAISLVNRKKLEFKHPENFRRPVAILSDLELKVHIVVTNLYNLGILDKTMWAALWILAIEALLGFALGSSLPPESKRHAECVPKATDTTGRSYTGYHSAPSVQAFLGIPFAQPPVGSLRWKPPKPLEHAPPGGQTLDATKFGKSCYQFQVTGFIRDPVIGEEFVRFTEVQTEQSEDCLTLNIWTPSRKKGKENLLPVLVWISGGGHSEGGTSVPGKRRPLHY